MTTIDQARQSYVSRFGEEQAQVIEGAGRENLEFNPLDSLTGEDHRGDNHGGQPFRYWFLLDLATGCITEHADVHGITPSVPDLMAWAVDRGQGDLAGHDGDTPDLGAALMGRYGGWLDEERLMALEEAAMLGDANFG